MHKYDGLTFDNVAIDLDTRLLAIEKKLKIKSNSIITVPNYAIGEEIARRMIKLSDKKKRKK